MEGMKILGLLVACLLAFIKHAVCEDCFYKASNRYIYYNGTEERTVQGHPCLRWDTVLVDYPEFNLQNRFRDKASASRAENYCRDIYKGNEDIYCYILNPNIQQTLCSAPYCNDPSGEHMIEVKGEAMRCRYLPESGECYNNEAYYCKDTHKIINSEKKINNCLKLFCCTLRGCVFEKSDEYNGTWRHTNEGTLCTFWNDSSLERQIKSSFKFPDESLDDARNYCRDPNLSGSPWCFTHKGVFTGIHEKRSCSIPICDEYLTRHRYNHDCYEITEKDRKMYQPLSDRDICIDRQNLIYLGQEENADEKYPGCKDCPCCQMKGCKTVDAVNYTGTWSRTISGRKCKLWTETGHGTPRYFPDKTVEDAYNYCRHTNDYMSGPIYCFTEDSTTLTEHCDIPDCDTLLSSTIESSQSTTGQEVATSALTPPHVAGSTKQTSLLFSNLLSCVLILNHTFQ